MQNYVSKFLGAAVVLGLVAAGCGYEKPKDPDHDTVIGNALPESLQTDLPFVRKIGVYHTGHRPYSSGSPFEADTTLLFNSDGKNPVLQSGHWVKRDSRGNVVGDPGDISNIIYVFTPEEEVRAYQALRAVEDNGGAPVLFKGGQRVE